MDQFSVWATMEAKPGRAADARAFLVKAAQRLTEGEPGTTSFHAMDLGDGRFAIFNSFADAAALEAHVGGPTAAWVMAMNPDLFTGPYEITRGRVFAQKRDGMALNAGGEAE